MVFWRALGGDLLCVKKGGPHVDKNRDGYACEGSGGGVGYAAVTAASQVGEFILAGVLQAASPCRLPTVTVGVVLHDQHGQHSCLRRAAV